MTPLASLFWLTELALESVGCFFAFRKRIAPLWLYLGFRAFGDLAGMVSLAFGSTAYWWTDFAQRTIQYPLCWILAFYLAAQVLKQDKRTLHFYAGMAGVMGVLAVGFFHAEPLTMSRLLAFELCAQGVSVALLLTAIGTVEGEHRLRPEVIWIRISMGLLIKAGWDVLISGLWSHGFSVSGLYPVGAIAALSVWVWACAMPEKENAVDLGLSVSDEDFLKAMGVRG